MHIASCLTISLNNLAANYQALQKKVGSGVRVAGVVKANAYGTGIKEIAKTLYHYGCREFYVDDCREGVELRDILGDDVDIFLLQEFLQGNESIVAQYKLIPVLASLFALNLWVDFAINSGKKLPCCLQIDTGMHRLGIAYEAVDGVLKQISEQNILDIKYILSHLACADDPSNQMNEKQLELFSGIKTRFPHYKYSLANSAGIYLSPAYHLDQVRGGIGLYGVSNFTKESRAVVSLDSKIIGVFALKPGDAVGYDATFIAKKDMITATIPVGYADGVFRYLSNKGHVYIENHQVPIIGLISMGLISLDISALPRHLQSIGQKVEIIGKHISLETLAKQADTICYELLTSFGNRYNKVYV